ncbi:glycosyltransferase family 4 protein [Sphingomonas sp.]|uniref:glycosyltransferase family 4 protein n=1 Tax=Sphingomonas sp. TaxID=28214 RepID=UPI003AFFDE03
MKILMLTSEFPPFRGGISTYARELAEAAAGRGHEVTVAAPAYGGDRTGEDGALPFRVLRFPGGANTPRAILDKIRWTRRLARRERFDVVHAIDWPFFLPLALSRYRRKARALLTFHGTEVNMMRRRSRAVLLKAVRFWSGWATSVTNSRFTAEHLLRTFPELDAATVRAVPLGVRPPEGAAPDRESARAALGVGADDVLMMTLGRVVERKGHHVLADALRLLPQEVKARLVWHVVGPENDAAYAARIKAAAAETGVRATFAGGLPGPEVERVFAAADLFCLPAVWGRNGEFEGFGLVYVEAGLRGVPAIGTRLGGIPDAVVDGETGLLVPTDDTAALADAIARFVEQPELRRRMGAAARRYAEGMTWARVAELTYA